MGRKLVCALCAGEPRHAVLGAEAAGMTGIWLVAGYSWPEGHAESRWKIDRLDEVLQLVAQAS